MLLAFDVGNTNIVLGVFDGEKLIRSWRMKTDRNKSVDEYGMLIHQLFEYDKIEMKNITDVIISTVVPPVLYTLQHLSRKYFHTKAIVVGPGVKTGMVIKYDNPKALGSDRIVNAVAAYHKYGGPLIIIDLGTATTFCAVNEKGEYLGGTIAPGLKISSEALTEKTSKLPKVEIEEPGKVICKNTIESIQAGLVYGHVGLVENVVARMKNELAPDGGPVTVVATGGMAGMISDSTTVIDHIERDLTLDGLRLIYKKNR
ncbi:MAG: type III pantothenate kinase [Firmicutes bacterium]|nr:type III pantothenate kinase [Bacillota bacterium]MBR2577093.1 type III pantothenate kinase [Bacillota bacterium]